MLGTLSRGLMLATGVLPLSPSRRLSRAAARSLPERAAALSFCPVRFFLGGRFFSGAWAVVSSVPGWAVLADFRRDRREEDLGLVVSGSEAAFGWSGEVVEVLSPRILLSRREINPNCKICSYRAAP